MPATGSVLRIEGEYGIGGLGTDRPFAVRATPGSAVVVPPGVPHSYRNVGATPYRMLAVFTTPAAEAFQPRAGLAAPQGRPTPRG